MRSFTGLIFLLVWEKMLIKNFKALTEKNFRSFQGMWNIELQTYCSNWFSAWNNVANWFKEEILISIGQRILWYQWQNVPKMDFYDPTQELVFTLSKTLTVNMVLETTQVNYFIYHDTRATNSGKLLNMLHSIQMLFPTNVPLDLYNFEIGSQDSTIDIHLKVSLKLVLM